MTVSPSISMEALKQLQEQLVARLSRFRRKVKRRLALAGVARVLAEGVGLGFLAYLLDRYLRLGIPARAAVLATGTGVLAWEVWRQILTPLRMRMGLVALAGAMDRNGHTDARHLAAQVASVLELPRLLESRDPPSPAMIEQAVRRCHESLTQANFDASLDPKKLQKTWGTLAAASLLPVALLLLAPGTVRLWANRLFLLASEPWPQATYLVVADVQEGRIRVPRGEPYVVRAWADERSKVVPRRVTMTIRGTGKTSVQMKQFAANDFRHDFAVIDQPLRLELVGGDDDYGPVEVEPVDRPRVVGLELEAKHPRQATPERHTFSGGDADMSFLLKTRLKLTVASNVPLLEVRIKAATPHPTPGDVQRLDGTHYAVDWTQEGPAKFELELVASDSGLVSLPVPVTVGLKGDMPPRVTMAYTGVRQRITPKAHIPLTIDIRDDFGVRNALLAVKEETPDPHDPAKLVAHESPQGLFPGSAAGTQPAAGEKDLHLKQEVDVGARKLGAGSLLSLTVEATDDCYTGQQTGRSRTVTFRLVPPEELFREILQRQQAERVKFRKQEEEAEKVRDVLVAATDVRPLQEAARRHRALQREVLRIATALEESLTEIKLNELGSPESHEMMDKTVLKPLRGLAEELIGPQTTALETLAPASGEGTDASKLAAALERQEQIISRMKSILKQMAQWDSFVDVLNQLDEIIKLETQVKEQTEKIQKKETEGLFED